MRQRGKVAFCVLHDCRIGWEGYLHGSMLLYMDKGRDLLANNFILFLNDMFCTVKRRYTS